MNEREMFEKSFQRPHNYFELSPERQWEIDKELGILDWKGEGLSSKDHDRFVNHYKKSKEMSRESRGKLVTFITKEGKKQVAVAYDSEQEVGFAKEKKVFLRHLDDKYHPIKDEEGKNICSLTDSAKLTITAWFSVCYCCVD